MEEPTPPSDGEALVSLKDFVDEHQKMIAVAGVFVALGLFWKSIDASSGQTPYISYLCFLVTVPIFFEIHRRYDFDKSEWNLVFFQNLFGGILFLTIGYAVIENVSHFARLLGGLIFFSVFIATNVVAERIERMISHGAYERALEFHKQVTDSNLSPEEKNGLVDEQNKRLKSSYRFAKLISVYGLLLSIVLSILIGGYAQSFLMAYSEVEIEQKPINEVSVQEK